MTTKTAVSTIFFFALLGFILFQAGRLFAPFFGPLLVATLLAIVFYPVHEWLGRRLRTKSRSLRALVSDGAVFLFFVIPLGLIIWATAVQVESLIPRLAPVVDRITAAVRSRSPENLPGVKYLPPFVKQRIDFRSTQVQERLQKAGGSALAWLAAFGTEFAKNIASIIVDLVVALFALFFLFRDGPGWYAKWNALLPLPRDAKARIDEKMHDTILGVVRGTFITSLAQTAVATIGFFIAPVRSAALFLGMLTFVATLIPSVGTMLVWIPVAVFLFLKGQIGWGIFIIIWGAVPVGFIDNVVRPFAVGGKADLPFFWLFFAILGGLQIFGMMGLVLGPLIIALVPVLLDIYKARFLSPADAQVVEDIDEGESHANR